MKIRRRVSAPFVAFKDRAHAGRLLAESVRPTLVAAPAVPVVLAVPNGGVPVAAPLAGEVSRPVDLAISAKLATPGAPGVAFGAVALDGGLFLDEQFILAMRLAREQVCAAARMALVGVRRRALRYTGGVSPPDVEGRDVYLVDDGLATGCTAAAAAGMLWRSRPARITLCVPVAPTEALRRTRRCFSDVHCLVEQREGPFAAGRYYADFRAQGETETLAILQRARRAAEEAAELCIAV